MESLFNNTKQYLPSLTAWAGRPEVTSGFVNLAVNVITTQDCTLTVYQSTDGSTFDFTDQFALPVSVFGNQTRTQFAVKALYVKVNVFNDTLVDIPNLIVTTTFSATSQDSSIEQPVIVAGNVTVLNAMKARDYSDNSVREVSCDINGQLKVVPVGTTDVSVYGQTPDFNFYPTAENNTATVYADGIKGTDVQGGWLYSNGATSKINWYLYTAPNPTGNPTSAGQSVASVSSMYAVVNNLSTLGLSQAQNPWIMIYTRPDSGTNGSGWYKSKLFFGSNAFTDVNGTKLLYTGTDPTLIHPEITGNNRINLLFNLSLSTKSLEDAQAEKILFGTLQTTNNTSTVGSFNFVFSQFGISWVKQLVALPIVDNAVSVNVSNSVVVNATNLITETLATRRVDFLVVGNWYRVASVGITSGAQWNAIGAIVDGESVPSIGRLFKCLSIGPAVAGGGECYDVEYTDAVSATISNFPATQAVSGTVSLSDPTSVRVRDSNGDSILTTAGNLMVGISNIYTANPLHTIVDSGPATQTINGTVSLADPTTVRVRDSNGDSILTTSGNLMVGISNIYTANPLHTILDSGTVGLSTSANTIKIDQASISTNGVRTIAPDTFSARVTTAGTTPVEVNEGGHLLSFLAVNTSATADAYVKLYDSVAAPNSAIDTPLLIAHVSRDAAARLPTIQVSTSNLKITNKLWVRAVTGSADNNTDVTGLSMDICFFGTAT